MYPAPGAGTVVPMQQPMMVPMQQNAIVGQPPPENIMDDRPGRNAGMFDCGEEDNPIVWLFMWVCVFGVAAPFRGCGVDMRDPPAKEAQKFRNKNP